MQPLCVNSFRATSAMNMSLLNFSREALLDIYPSRGAGAAINASSSKTQIDGDSVTSISVPIQLDGDSVTSISEQAEFQKSEIIYVMSDV